MLLSMEIINPNKFLNSLEAKIVKIKLKWGTSYQGKLESYDSYMNIRLNETEEWIDDVYMGNLGQILIRCNNIAYISEVTQ